MGKRQLDQFDIEAEAEATADRILKGMRPKGLKPYRKRGMLNRQVVAAAKLSGIKI